ncbi:hypothetical protein D3C84_1117460 [compost metagenome]
MALALRLGHIDDEHKPHQCQENACHLDPRHFFAEQHHPPDDRKKRTELQEQRSHTGTDPEKHAVVHQPTHPDSEQQTI